MQQITTELEVKDTGLLNAISDAQHVDTSALRDCRISTTISEVRYGTYESENETHEACIVFFCFELVGQRRKSSQRIKELTIKLSLFPSQTTAASPSTSGSSKPALEIRWREPNHGRTKTSQMKVSKEATIGGQAGYQFAGVNSSYSVSKTQDVADWGSLESYIERKRHVYFCLRENAMLEDGVPARLECVLVIRTDGMPFKLGASFKAKIPYLGKLWTREATTEALVDDEMLSKNKNKSKSNSDGDDSTTGLDDVGSDRFMQWTKGKIRNEWIEDT